MAPKNQQTETVEITGIGSATLYSGDIALIGGKVERIGAVKVEVNGMTGMWTATSYSEARKFWNRWIDEMVGMAGGWHGYTDVIIPN